MSRKFAWSIDNETFRSDEFNTRIGALAAAFSDTDAQTIYVGEVVPPPMPEEFIEADAILEHAGCQDAYSGEWAEGWDTSTKAQREELTAALRATMREWRERHNLTPSFYNIENSRAYDRAAKAL